MKVAIVAPSPVPFLIGGAEKLFMGMLNYLNQLSVHDVELIKVPCKDWEFWSLIEGYKKFSELKLDHFDMVVTTKYPAWMIEHPNHVIYMQHTCRGVYDLYHLTKKSTDWRSAVKRDRRLHRLGRLLDSKPERSVLPELFCELDYLRSIESSLPRGTFDFPGPLTRAVIQFLDRVAFQPSSPSRPTGIKAYYAISKNVTKREGYFPPGVEVKVVYHPSNLEEFHSVSYDFIFTASRLESLKRIDLLIKAFKRVKGDIKFLIAGTGGQERALRQLAKGDDRIEFLGFITDKELIDYYSRALFVPFIPYDEDYGLITIEAMKSGKAVLTAYDSGGVTEFVKTGYNGLVTSPDVDSLAEAIQYLVDNRERAVEMGRNASESVSFINWENMVASFFGKEALKERGTAVLKPPEVVTVNPERSKPRLLVLSTFPVNPPISGGRLRIYNLYRNLSRTFKVTVLTLGHENSTFEFNDSFLEVQLKRGSRFNLMARKIMVETGVSSDDIASIEGYRLVPGFEERLDEFLRSTDAVVLVHPYLVKAVSHCRKPVFYDAPDVEYIQKSSMFKSEKYLAMVRDVEKEACNRAKLIYPTSQEDAIKLKELYGVNEDKFLVVENGVDTSRIELLRLDEKRALKERLGLGNRAVAVFAGSLHKPNIDAVHRVESLAKEFPDAIFIVLGGAGEVLKNPPPNLIPVGVVSEEEKDIIMKAADIGLNPVVSGSGTNLKLLEYLAYGLAVLTTPFGARGIRFKDEVFVAEIGDFPQKFEYLVDFVGRDSEFESLRYRARSLSELYDWSRIAEKLEKKVLNFLTT